MKKILCSMLVLASLSFSSGAVLAGSSEETVTSNNDLTRAAYVHTSSRVIAKNGSYGYTKAYTYDGSKIHYLKATMKATYSNGQVSGGSASNKNTSNIASATTTEVYENGPKRQYHSSSEARNTASSALERLSGKSAVFN